ncbi:NADP-dependent phosphogluconate dehydrogenase [Pseudooctadecabacter jejudonensis]|uniref:6-phosphogluconate dehydrogenase, decarboxylating n=1 Tax=Pseudooctadecabacter jejudonensis TaxID=1391910 RepID=A0A1Y5SQI7_9RHOB|nr:NADP-dependent phosphogluconate dehydrogenase [Pseudooctadecabacter jejudonensis]SLN42990.1 6-phosphogluconate dehydrogenase, NADP(+)-dependent, decarboxylating [Pseudooctadecabacter jejudonensis]
MTDTATLGLYGLGTMGSALALNILDKGFGLYVSNRSAKAVPAFVDEARDEGLAERLTGSDSLEDMVKAMPAPRAIILMVPSGRPVDSTIDTLIPLLEDGDTIIDAGNSDFRETRARTAKVEDAGLTYIGMGVSGGEDGARHGPSIMVGGTPEAWDAVRPVIEAISAKFEGAPCADHLGPDGAGHFVKTVHNGIEYADMQLIAEIYGLMRYGRGDTPAEIGKVFEGWDDGPLGSYLVEITGKVLQATDTETGKPAVDVILDAAGQKGTGRWTAIEAIRMGRSASIIEAAVAARALSSEVGVRAKGEDIFGACRAAIDLSDEILHDALLVGRILSYAQGFRILKAASEEFDWSIDMARTAEVWRAGCIIRSVLLDDIASAFRSDLPEGELIFAPPLVDRLKAASLALRKTVCAAATHGHATPALSSALFFLDTMRHARGTADVIQAQRDFFGRHGFVRLDGREDQHGPWWDDAG